MSGEDLGNTTLRKLLPRHEFGLADDRIEQFLTDFRENPETIPTQLRVVTLRGTPGGLEVSLRPGEKGRLVKTDLRTHPGLADACRTHVVPLEAPLRPLRETTLKKFAADYEKARAVGMKLGTIGEYLDTLGGDLLVGGLGYHLVGRTPDKAQEFRCIYEDEAGAVYFLVPSGVTTFDIVERTFEGQEPLFGEEMLFNVTVAPPAAAPAKPPAAEPVSEPAATEPAMEAGEAGQPDATLPENFFGTDQ